MLFDVNLVASFFVDPCCGLLRDANGNDAGICCLSFGVSCFCVDGVNVNDGIGCWTCGLLVG